MLVKILGAIDISCAIAFLMLTFGMPVFAQFTLFCAGLLMLKGLFVLKGELLSVIDLISSFILIFSIFFTLPAIIYWIPSFLLLSKGFVSFL
ncbi:MAG: hypothetical protein AABW65_01935 [Nanoarchaeota archaeon]